MLGGVRHAALASTRGALMAAFMDGGMTWREHVLLPASVNCAQRSQAFLVVDDRLCGSSIGRVGGCAYLRADGKFRRLPGWDFTYR
jgi:hypothetical protein